MPRFIARFAVFTVLVGVLVAPLLTRDVIAQEATPAACPPLTQEEAEAWVATYFAPWNSHDSSLLADVISDDYVHHWGIGIDIEGADAFMLSLDAFFAAFPGIHVSIEDVFVAGDIVAIRWIAIGVQELEFMGIPPSQKTVTWTGINLVRVECGIAVESWAEADHFGRIQQQGAIPVAEATPEA